jgi:5-methylcytosine-specific restriction endonuclease McrA
VDKIKEFISKINTDVFTSNTHTKQTRIFGYITTNIRSPHTIVGYIEELLPEYIKRKNKPSDWKDWCYNANQQQKHKQKFKRLELASLLFRNVENNTFLNFLSEKLYDVIQTHGKEYTNAFLYIYLLAGRYFGIDKQPLVNIDKVLNAFNGNFIKEAKDLIVNKNFKNRLFLSAVLYNPNCDIAYETAYKILSNKIPVSDLENLYEYIDKSGSPLKTKIVNAGGKNNFTSDIFTVANYYIFKEACLENIEIYNLREKKENIINKYVDLFFDYGFNKFLKIKDDGKDILKQIYKELSKSILEVIFYASGIKEKDREAIFDKNTKRNFSTDQKQDVIKKYQSKCFFDYSAIQSDWHEAGYFLNKKQLRYLEIHHIIKLEHSHLFKNDINIKENMIPLCPNCHRKLHNAQDDIVKNLLTTIYSGIDKKAWIKNGIFVDINTLGSFYGLAEDLEKNK